MKTLLTDIQAFLKDTRCDLCNETGILQPDPEDGIEHACPECERKFELMVRINSELSESKNCETNSGYRKTITIRGKLFSILTP